MDRTRGPPAWPMPIQYPSQITFSIETHASTQKLAVELQYSNNETDIGFLDIIHERLYDHVETTRSTFVQTFLQHLGKDY